MKKLILFSLVILAITSNAQPVLTAVNSNPVVGDAFKWNLGNNVSSPGNAGENQTWDFSSLTSSYTENDSTYAPSATPYYVTFPSANASVYDGISMYGYYNTNVDSLTFFGNKDNSNNTYICSDPQQILIYPLTYNSTFIDNFSAISTSSGTTTTITETDTILSDGYGTLKLPSGTFTNVLRIKRTGLSTQVTDGVTNYYQVKMYFWYSPGTHLYILRMSYNSGSYRPIYRSGISTDIIENKEYVNDIVMFPNPTSDNISIITKQNSDIEFLNIEGQIIKKLKITDNKTDIDISDFASGVYIIRAQSDSGITTEKFIKE